MSGWRDPRRPPELAAVLFRRTLLVTAAVALIAAIGLCALTIVNVSQEVRAARELVEQAVRASRLLPERPYLAGPAGSDPARPCETAGLPAPALLEPDQSMLRGLRLQLVDGASGTALADDGSGNHGGVDGRDRAHDGRDRDGAGGTQDGAGGSHAGAGAGEVAGDGSRQQEQRPLLDRLAERWFGVSDHFAIPLTEDDSGPALLVRGHATGELKEQLIDMSIVLVALGLVVAVLGLSHRWVVRGVRDPLADMTQAASSMAEGELSRRIPEPRIAEFASLARALNHLAASLEQTRTLQNELTTELVSLRETERKSLARELHDDLGQRLAVIAAETHLLRVQLKTEDVAVRSIAAGIQSLQHSVRSILERLRQGQPMVMPDPDAAAILDEWRRREPRVHWQADDLGAGALGGFGDAARETLARVLREALANAFRHARPSRVSVRLLQDEASCRLIVGNDGVLVASQDGRDGQANGSDAACPGRPYRYGHGILGMSERAHGSGGSLRSRRSPESGDWELVLTLPKSAIETDRLVEPVAPAVPVGEP